MYKRWCVLGLDDTFSDKYGCVCQFEFAGHFCEETMYDEVNAPTKWAVGLYNIALRAALPHGGNSLRWSELAVWDTDECAIDNGGCGDPSTQWCENRCSEAPGCHNTLTLLSGDSPVASALSAAPVHPRSADSVLSNEVHTSLGMGRYGGVFLLHGGDFQRPWKRCSMVAKWPLEVEIAMGTVPMPISVSSGHFALRYEVPSYM